MSATLPETWTTTIALVRSVMAGSISSGSIVPVRGSTSTIMGIALIESIAAMVAKKLQSGTITSSPSPTPNESNAASRVLVPLVIATACSAPVNSRHSLSNERTSVPWDDHHCRLSKTLCRAFDSPESNCGHAGKASDRTGVPPNAANGVIY